MAYKRELIINNGSLTSYKKLLKVSDVCQLLDKSKYLNNDGYINNGNGTITTKGIPINYMRIYNDFDINDTASIPKELSIAYRTYGHKLLILDSGNNSPGTSWKNSGGLTWELNGSRANAGGSYSGQGEIFTNNKLPLKDITRSYFYIVNPSGYTFTCAPQLFDLTEMYGAGNEPKTVAEFKAKFPNDLYDYSPRCWVTSYKTGLIAKTKNLFDIPLVQGYPSNTDSYDNTTLRTFTFGTYIIGMSRNNYYVPEYVTDVNISKNSISFNNSSSGFGISVPFLLTVGNTYTVSCKSDNNDYPTIGITYYKEDGTLISFTESERITNNPVKSFTVPENTYYTLILFYGRLGNEYTFSNIQLEEGSTATDYVPYGYL